MSKIFISCALPYANGPCHLGHIRSTYLPADIYARYNRMIGNDVLMVCAELQLQLKLIKRIKNQ